MGTETPPTPVVDAPAGDNRAARSAARPANGRLVFARRGDERHVRAPHRGPDRPRAGRRLPRHHRRSARLPLGPGVLVRHGGGAAGGSDGVRGRAGLRPARRPCRRGDRPRGRAGPPRRPQARLGNPQPYPRAGRARRQRRKPARPERLPQRCQRVLDRRPRQPRHRQQRILHACRGRDADGWMRQIRPSSRDTLGPASRRNFSGRPARPPPGLLRAVGRGPLEGPPLGPVKVWARPAGRLHPAGLPVALFSP